MASILLYSIRYIVHPCCSLAFVPDISLPLVNDVSLLSVNIVIYVLTQGYGPVEPRSVSYRYCLLTSLFLAIVLHVSYSSSLITLLTTNTLNLPFKDLRGLYERRNEYTLYIEEESFIQQSVHVCDKKKIGLAQPLPYCSQM